MDQIRQRHNSSNLFIDHDFPGMDEHDTWARPSEMAGSSNKVPKFISDTATRFDIKQGYLGDCWFLAAMQVVIENEKLSEIILCKNENSFEENKYTGAFVFKFWQYGEWIEIIIDDRIPCQFRYKKYYPKNLKVGDSGENNDEEMEFWPCLLEKAYAKLKGGYKNIIGGLGNEAFTDLAGSSGGVITIE